jgi:hypothetical protein
MPAARIILSAIALALLPRAYAADPAPSPAQADRFDVEATISLKKSAAEKKGVELIVAGEHVAGYVTAIGPDSVVLTSREHGRVVVRRDRIDAVLGE